MGTEINRLTIPLAINFKHIAVSQRESVIGTCCAGRIIVVIQDICRKCFCPGTANLSPVAVCRSFVKLACIEPLSNLVVHVLGDVLVVAVQPCNPLVIRGQRGTICRINGKRISQRSISCGHVILIYSLFRSFIRNHFELDSRQDDVAFLVFIGQLSAKVLKCFEVLFTIGFIHYRNQAAIACRQVFISDLEGIRGICSTINALPVSGQSDSAFIRKLPFAIFIQTCSVGVFLVCCIDFGRAVISLASRNGIPI